MVDAPKPDSTPGPRPDALRELANASVFDVELFASAVDEIPDFDPDPYVVDAALELIAERLAPLLSNDMCEASLSALLKQLAEVSGYGRDAAESVGALEETAENFAYDEWNTKALADDLQNAHEDLDELVATLRGALGHNPN